MKLTIRLSITTAKPRLTCVGTGCLRTSRRYPAAYTEAAAAATAIPAGRAEKWRMTPNPQRPTKVHIRRVLACPSSMPPAALPPSQCLSGRSRSQNPWRRPGASSETASIMPSSESSGCAFGAPRAPASRGRGVRASENPRQGFPDRAAKHGIRDAVEGRRLRVDDDYARACVLRGRNDPGDRINLQACADGDEQV